ncbi:MAG: leucine-rich repeat domain-containing protein [Anaerotignum sp.]
MKLSIQIAYKLEEKGAVITKVWGRAAEIRIPETIDGVPVVAIGERAFAVKEEAPLAEPADELEADLSFAETGEEPAAEGQALRRVFLPDSIETIGDYAFSGCSALERMHLPTKLTAISQRMFDGCGALEQLTLPAGLRSIGDYAFYGCGSLKRLHLPEGVQRIGKYAFYNCRKMEEINIPLAATDLNTGLFLNCDSLTYLSFGRCRHISDLTSGLNHELHLTIDFPIEGGETKRAKLVIPDFQYEYIEDTPARLFHQVNYGTGHIFRQCIGNSDIDFRRYDEIFYLTRREDAADTVLLLAMARLEYPYRLQEKHREVYLEYIRDHFLWAAEYFMNRREGEKIRLFADWGLLTAENLPDLIDLAQKKGQTAVLSFLMDYQHKHFGTTKKKKTFEL